MEQTYADEQLPAKKQTFADNTAQYVEEQWCFGMVGKLPSPGASFLRGGS